MPNTKILVADDDKNIRYAFRELLSADGFDVIEACDGIEALAMLDSEHPDLLFLDVSMPELDGLAVLERMKEGGIDVPVIVVTAFGTMETAIRAVRSGAYEYLTKPLDVHKIRLLLRRCLDERRMKSELDILRKKLPATGDLYELVGNSPAMEKVFKTIGAVAATPNLTNVLIVGESGTGKELVARQIHRWSAYSKMPFVPINVTVLPDSLIESELFGYEKGAFTGATSSKAGKFEQAGEGSIFLDEIGDLSPGLQHKLLRVIQEREYVRLGGLETKPVKARFIAATHDDIERKVADKTFREDLYYRLNVVTIHIPPLRTRKEDIPLLSAHFVAKFAARMGRNSLSLTPETIDFLCNQGWPGNVRELENTISRALVMARGERLLPTDFTVSEVSSDKPIDPPILHHNLKQARRMLMESFEQKFLEQRLRESGGNVTRAAAHSGINRQSFQRLMQKHCILSERNIED